MADMAFAAGSPALADLGASSTSGGILRFTTAGSVDDGKSTLIGRLLYDSKAVYEDQLDSVRRSRINRASGPLDFSLLTDGLRAEREQGITIDVAYRYFSTPKRKFIIADTPGHEQYTRNMATGASTADAAIVLVDATKGLLPQSRRHAYIASLLGIRHVVAAVNKMDLAGYDEATFRSIESDVERLAARLGLPDLYVLPISALEGDNVVRRSPRMTWFGGPPLLDLLESLRAEGQEETGPIRFPVQYVIRPDASFRGFAGQVASGTIHAGAPVVALPSGQQARVREVVRFQGESGDARKGESVTLTLDRELDLSRGDMLVAEDARPAVSGRFRANVVWMDGNRLEPARIYLLKHTTRTVRARVRRILHRIEVETLDQVAAPSLGMNDIATVEIETTSPLFFDRYQVNRTTGSFVLIDPVSNATAAAGMIECALEEKLSAAGPLSAQERRQRLGHPAAAVWVRNAPAAAERIERQLFHEGWQVQLLSLEEFSGSELAGAAKALQRMGAVVIVSASDADRLQREKVRELHGPDSFFDGDAASVEGIVPLLRRWRASKQEDEEKA